MLQVFDDDESIVMSLGKERVKSRMAKLGMSEVQVYQLRTVARGQKPKNPVEMPKESPAVTAGSSPESKKTKSKPKKEPKSAPASSDSYAEASKKSTPQSLYAMGLSDKLGVRPAAVYDWAQKHKVDLSDLMLKHGSGLTSKSAKNNSPEYRAMEKAFWQDKPFSYKGKKTPSEGIKPYVSKFINLDEDTPTPKPAKATRAKTTKPKETKPKEPTPKKEPKSRWKPGDRILY